MGLLETHAIALVTRPAAGLTGTGTEKTATQEEAATGLLGLLAGMTTEAAFRAFGIETRRPFRLKVAIPDAPSFVVGGQVSGITMASSGDTVEAGPLYIVAPPKVMRAGLSTDHATVLLDVQMPRTSQSGTGLSALTAGSFGGGF